jgi:hypothetical protein
MRLNGGLLFWGLAFVTAGAVAFAIRQGVIAPGFFVDAWRLWPLILIAIGISIIFARTAFSAVGLVIGALLLGSFAGALFAAGPVAVGDCSASGAAGGVTQQRNGTFSDGARVDLTFNCGTLEVTAQQGADWNVSTSSSREGTPQISGDGNRLTISSGGADFLGAQSARQDWTVQLPTQPKQELSVDANAASTRIALPGMHLTSVDIGANAGELRLDAGRATADSLKVEVNAGSASVIVDGESQLDGTLSVNAGSIKLCAPAELGLQITLGDNVAFGNNLDASGLERDGDTWRSPSYATASRRVTLEVSGNAGSFDLNPTGGCQ